MLILALDSSTDRTSVCLGTEQGPAGCKEILSSRYTEKIILLIDGLLREHNLQFSDIEGFAVGAGPGSFTGTRAGVSTIKALAQVAKKPAVSISSTYMIAAAAAKWGKEFPVRKITVLTDARRNEILWSDFLVQDDNLKNLTSKLISIVEADEIISKPNEDKSVENILTGDGLSLLKSESMNSIKITPEDIWLPHAKYLIESAIIHLKKASWRNLFDIKPIYWRPSDAVKRRAV